MRLLWRTTAFVGTIALICGAVIVWHLAKVRASHRKLTAEANACRLRAGHGDANAQYEMARLYYHGKGVPQNYTEALSWYRKAANQGNVKAQYAVGFMYDEGKGAPQDYGEAASWYRKAADQGDSRAEYALAYLYQEGRGFTQDRRAAIEWCRKAADQGYARAQFGLGLSYFDGWGVPQDYAKATNWLLKAADQGYAKAQTYLGYMYSQGKGVPQDNTEAVRWYRKAAAQGDPQAQYSLGYMYYYGLGLPRDQVQANRLFHAAATQGNEDARRFTTLNICQTVGSKIMPPFKFLTSLYFLLVFLKSGQPYRSRGQLFTAMTALLLMCSVVLDLFWYSYIGYLQSSTAITTFYFLRHLLEGSIIALLLFIVIPKGAKRILVSAIALFIASIVVQAVHWELKHIAPSIGLLSFVAFPIGMAIPPAIILWLDRKISGGLRGKVDGLVPVTTK